MGLNLGFPRLYDVVLKDEVGVELDFVLHSLRDVFNKTQEQAVHMMAQFHKEGRVVAATCSLVDAEASAMSLIDYAEIRAQLIDVEIKSASIDIRSPRRFPAFRHF